ncbi:RNA recognition motif-containing protein [Cyclospora cayetanensis]|uniref:RNA recognition motif-containing protein n=1 Tax=Cyclospora cayetanensis TaxID=88456 RepID=A0A1D3D643_9EIME|nr:RNA recognition motif-containing protein [Cyclospora cayetanensis]
MEAGSRSNQLRSCVAGGPGTCVRQYMKLKALASCSKATVWLVQRQQEEDRLQQQDDDADDCCCCSAPCTRAGTSLQYFALKEIPLSSVKSTKQAEHLWGERRCLEALRGNPIAQKGCHKLEECFREDGFLYFVFEFLPGGPLFRHIRAAGALPLEQAKWYAAEGAGLKLCTHTRRPRAASFCGTRHAMAPEVAARALARESTPPTDEAFAEGPPATEDLSSASSKTVPKPCDDTAQGATSGIAQEGQGSPEQKEGYLGPPVDWWGLGVLLYECLTGFLRIWDLAACAPESVAYPESSHLPVEAKDLIKALLQADPQRRLGTQGGAAEVKAHPFFSGIPWDLLGAPPGALSPEKEEALRAAIPPFDCAAADSTFALLRDAETSASFFAFPPCASSVVALFACFLPLLWRVLPSPSALSEAAFVVCAAPKRLYMGASSSACYTL